MNSEKSQTDENDSELKSNEETNILHQERQSTVTQTCDHHPLSFMAMDYYKKYGENRDFPQYFILNSADTDVNCIGHSVENTNTTESKQDENKSMRPPLIGQDNINSDANEDVLECVQPTSPASSIASNKRLEWDSGADVGYSNYFNNKCRDRANSLPHLSMVEHLVLAKRMLRLEPEGVTNENQQHTITITRSVLPKQDQSEGDPKEHFIRLNKSDETETKNAKLHLGTPNAESTPLLQNTKILTEKKSEITPIGNNPSENENSKSSGGACQIVEYISSEGEVSNLAGNNRSKKLTDVSEKSNEEYERSLNLSKKSSNSCEDISLSPSISVDKIRKYRSYSNLDYEIITSRTSRQADRIKKGKKILSGKSEKQIQTTNCNKSVVSRSVQVSDSFMYEPKKADVKLVNVGCGDNYIIRSSSEDPLEGSSKMHRNLSEHQHVTGTFNLPKSNSFEYLPGDTYEKITSSDLQTESESMSNRSKNTKNSSKSVERLSDVSMLHSDETHDKLYKAKYPLKNDNHNSQLQPSSSNFSQTSSGLISTGNISLNSTCERLEKSRFSNSLVVDLEKTIDLLKKLVESKKCSINDKKKLIKIVVKKLIEANYEEDSDFSGLQMNKSKLSTAFLKTSDLKKAKNRERKNLQDTAHSENTEDDILLHIYDRLGIEEDENGIIRKKKKHITTGSKVDHIEKRDDFGVDRNVLQTSQLEKKRRNGKASSKSHTCCCRQEVSKINPQGSQIFKEKVKSNVRSNSEMHNKKSKSKENSQKITPARQSRSDRQIRNRATENNDERINYLHKTRTESVDSHNMDKVCRKVKSVDENLNSKKETFSNHVDKNLKNRAVYKDHSTNTTSNFESNSYDSTYNTSSSRTNWRENKTLSEKLYEKRTKCKHDCCAGKNCLLKKKNSKPLKTHVENRCSIDESETVRQRVAMKDSNDNKGNKLLKFVSAEREIQLSWIHTEIKHLNNLRALLEKQTASNIADESIVPIENKKTVSAPVKTFITNTTGSDSSLKEKISTPLQDNQLKHSKSDEISDNSVDQFDLEWSSHKNMKVCSNLQINLRNKCQNLNTGHTSDLSIRRQAKDIVETPLDKLTSFTSNKNHSQGTKYIQNVENMHLNTVINKDLVFASGDAKPRECHGSYRVTDETDLCSKHFSFESKKSDTYTDNKHSRLHDKGIRTVSIRNAQSGVHSDVLNDDLTMSSVINVSQNHFSPTYLNETGSVQKKIEVDLNRIKNEQVCNLKDQKHPESVSTSDSLKKQSAETKMGKPSCVHSNVIKPSRVIDDEYRAPRVSTYDKEHRESFTQTPSTSNSRHSSHSGKELKLISDVGKCKTIDAFTQTEKYEGNNVAGNFPEKKTEKSHSDSTDISSDVFACSNQSEKSSERIQEINKDYNPSLIDRDSNVSAATLTNSIKCQFCTQIATRKKVIESIKNCKCCRDSENVHSAETKSYELCSRCDKIIQSKVIRDQKCLNCFHEISRKSSSKHTTESQTLSGDDKKISSAEPKGPIAYFLKVESKEDLRNSEDEKLQRKSVPLEEVKVFVPKRRTQKNTFSNLNFQFNQVNNILMNRYGLEKENNPSMSSQSNLDSNAMKKSTLSLQEYLVKNRPDFVDIAEARRKCLLDLALLRQFRKEKQKMLWSLREEFVNVDSDRPQNTRRIFTTKMMKDITKKRYKKLPEIQRRAYEQKTKQEALTNRLMAQIFNKKLQQKVHKGQITLSHTVSVISSL